MRRHHDMGGLPAGPIEKGERDHEVWEKKVDAILRLLTTKGIMRVDELRRGIEEIGPGAYDQLGYYERWITSITNILLEKGVLEVEELGRRIEAVEAAYGRAHAP